jgi:hypothetical protein
MPPAQRFHRDVAVRALAPQFQFRLSFVPSRFDSPFASLRFTEYETTSFSVNPSRQVTKLTLISGSHSVRP